MTLKTLTATNQRVQFYLTYTTEKPNTAAKRTRLAALTKSLQEQGIMFDEIFPSKQLSVLDQILYITSGAGIAKVGADKLAEKCGVSKTTVYNAVRALKETGEFVVARLIKTSGGAGKYIFIDKRHFNFKEIMREVFTLSDAKICELFVGQKNEETVGAVSVDEENKGSNFININLKQEKDNYISDIENIKRSIETEVSIPTREYVEQYASNPFQIAFYDLLSEIPYDSSILRLKHVLALRIGSDADIKRFNTAKNIIQSIAIRISDGYEFENIVAAFTAALKNAVNYEKIIKVESKPKNRVSRVTFYNWLEDNN